jgi:hypothetical protein
MWVYFFVNDVVGRSGAFLLPEGEKVFGSKKLRFGICYQVLKYGITQIAKFSKGV